MKTTNLYSRIAQSASRFCGRPAVFAFAVLLIIVWLVSGPIFKYSDTWQLVINTATTIVPNIPIFFDIASTSSRLDKPWMTIGCMIDNKIDH